jgi:hypothetical protein
MLSIWVVRPILIQLCTLKKIYAFLMDSTHPYQNDIREITVKNV